MATSQSFIFTLKMKHILFVITACMLCFMGRAQMASDIIKQVLDRQQQINHLSYTLMRTETIGNHIRSMKGTVIIETDKSDTLLGFRFWSKKETDAIEKMYNGRIGYAIDPSKGQYEIYYSRNGVLNLFNGGGGHLIMRDLIKIDTTRSLSCTLDSDDTAFYLLFRYPDLKEYDVFNRYKKISISKITMLPIAVREHQESYGRIQDLYFHIITCQERETALRYDFFNPDFLKSYSMVTPDRQPSPVHVWKGKRFPTLELPAFDSGRVSFDNLKGKVVLVDFWEVWCAPCIESMPKVQELYDSYRHKGLEIYGVVNDTTNFNATRQLIAKKKIRFPFLQGNMRLQQQLGINSIPLYVVIDRSGIVRFIEQGFSEKIEQAIKIYLEE